MEEFCGVARLQRGLISPEGAEEEILSGMKGSNMIFGNALDLCKAAIELIGQRVFCVLFDGEATTVVGAVVGKGPDDGVPFCLDAVSGYGQVGGDLGCGGQEMKCGAVMP